MASTINECRVSVTYLAEESLSAIRDRAHKSVKKKQKKKKQQTTTSNRP